MKLMILLCMSILLAYTAHSQNCFDYSAIACIAKESAIKSDAYRQTHGMVYHNATSIQPITLFGPVLLSASGSQSIIKFYFTYRDPDELGTKSRAAIALKRVNKKTGAVEQMESLDSNNPVNSTDATPGAVKTISTQVLKGLDYLNYYYLASRSEILPIGT